MLVARFFAVGEDAVHGTLAHVHEESCVFVF